MVLPVVAAAIRGATVASRSASSAMSASARSTRTGARPRETSPAVSAHGVRNVAQVLRERRGPERRDSRSIPARYRKQGLSRFAEDPWSANRERQQAEGEARGVEQEETNERQSPRRHMRGGVMSSLKRGVKKVTRAARAIGSFWPMVTVAFFASFLMFVFGAISLAFLATGAVIDDFTQNTWTGWFFSFIDWKDLLGVESLAMAFWGITLFIAFIGFAFHWAWFRVIGVNPMGSMASTLVTFACMGAAILIPTNIFFPLLVWVVYLELNAVFLRD